MKALSRLLLIAASTALVTACGASSSSPVPVPIASPGAPATAPTPEPSAAPIATSAPSLTIGLLVPYTESAVNSERGLAQKRAADLYLAQQGGLLGGQSASIVYGDESLNGALDVTKAQELVQQNAFAVLGLLGDDGAAAVRAYADANKIPLIVTGASGNALTRTAPSPYVLRASYTNWQLSEPLGEWAAGKGAKAFDVVHASDTFGTESAAAFVEGLGKAGGKATSDVTAQPGGDWAALVASIKAQPAKAVFAAFAGADATAFIGAWADAGMAAAGYSLYGPGPLAGVDVLATVKDKAVGITTSSFWASTLTGADNTTLATLFPKTYQDEAGNPSPVDADVIEMWDAMRAVDAAVKAAGTSSSDAFSQAVAGASVTGARGVFTFGPQTHNVVEDIYIRQVTATGGSVANQVVATVPSVADPGH
jgi:branched-chain amino acid transport system substrate-binding protein